MQTAGGSLTTTECGHLRPHDLIFTDRANKTSTVHGVTCDHRMRSLTTTKHFHNFHNRTTEGGGVGGGGVGGMITYLGGGGVGEGGVKFLHIERKITSVVHSHPPSHYIRKHAPG